MKNDKIEKILKELKGVDSDFILPICGIKLTAKAKTFDNQYNDSDRKLIITICDGKYKLVCYKDNTKQVNIDINIIIDESEFSTISYFNHNNQRLPDVILKDISKIFKSDIPSSKEKIISMFDTICSICVINEYVLDREENLI